MIGKITEAMAIYDAGDKQRINHFIKVYGYAKAIGELEGLEEERQLILEAAALTHDIGIRASLRKYGNANGRNQQTEGPPIAKQMLEGLGCDRKLVERVCWLIAHHHEYDDIKEADHQILVEADFLVNMDEGGMDKDAIASVKANVFRTRAGLSLLGCLFGA